MDVGASLGFCTGDADVDMVCGCCCGCSCFAVASAPELENGHMVESECVVCDFKLLGHLIASN